MDFKYKITFLLLVFTIESDAFICNKKEYIGIGRPLDKKKSIEYCRKLGYKLLLPESMEDIECFITFNRYSMSWFDFIVDLTKDDYGTWIRGDNGEAFNTSIMKIYNMKDSDKCNCIYICYTRFCFISRHIHGPDNKNWFLFNCLEGINYPVCERKATEEVIQVKSNRIDDIKVKTIETDFKTIFIHGHYNIEDARYVCMSLGKLFKEDDINEISPSYHLHRRDGRYLPSVIWIESNETKSKCKAMVIDKSFPDFRKTYEIDCNSKIGIGCKRLIKAKYGCNGKIYTLLGKKIKAEYLKVIELCEKYGSKTVLPQNSRDQSCVENIISQWPGNSESKIFLDPKPRKTTKDLNYTHWDSNMKYELDNSLPFRIFLSQSFTNMKITPGQWMKDYHSVMEYHVLCEKKYTNSTEDDKIVKRNKGKKVRISFMKVTNILDWNEEKNKFKFGLGILMNSLLRRFQNENYSIELTEPQWSVGMYYNFPGFKYNSLIGQLEECKTDLVFGPFPFKLLESPILYTNLLPGI